MKEYVCMSESDQAVARQLRPEAEPFLYPGGPVGLMLIHGYTGTPDELRRMGQHLAHAGYTVNGILLAHHGGLPADLHNTSWHSWVDSAEHDFLSLQQRCPQIVLVGFSMGALVALYLAACYPVAGLILLAPALYLRNERPLALASVGKYVVPWLYPLQRADFSDPKVRASVREFMPDADLDNPTVVAQLRRDVRLPTSSIHELVKLKRIMLRNLWRITQPVLIMQGRADQTVDPVSAERVFAGVRSVDKRLEWFEQAGHMLPREGQAERVWQMAAHWLQERVPVDRSMSAYKEPL